MWRGVVRCEQVVQLTSTTATSSCCRFSSSAKCMKLARLCMCTSWSRERFLPASRGASFFVSFPAVVAAVAVAVAAAVVVAAVVVAVRMDVSVSVAVAVVVVVVVDDGAVEAAAVGWTATDDFIPLSELVVILSVAVAVGKVGVTVATVVVAGVLLSPPPAATTTELPLLVIPLALAPAPALAPLLLPPLLPPLLLATTAERTSDGSAGVAIFKSFSIDASLAAALDSSIRNGFRARDASLLRVATTNASTSSTGGSCEDGWGSAGSPSFSAASR